MKNLFLLLSISIIIFTTSCGDDEQQNQDGELQLTFEVSSAGNGRTQEDFNPTNIRITILDENQQAIFNREEFNVTTFGNGFLVEPILLEIGNYQITEFLVLNAENEIILATPTQNSILENLINQALPVDFEINSDNVSEINLEVISTEGIDPENLGYTSLSFNVVPTINVLVSTFSVNESNSSYNLSESTLTVNGDGSLLITQQLGDSINVVKLKTGIEIYEFVATLANGLSVSVIISGNEINQYISTPLDIIISEQSSIPNGLYSFVRPNNILRINDETGESSNFISINNIPDNVALGDITYDSENNVFYLIGNSTEEPILCKIDARGNYTEVGTITINGNSIDIVEALAYDNQTGKLYLGASLNGGVDTGDFLSESLLTVDLTTAQATLITELSSSSPTSESDMDYITINNGTLFIADGAPPSANFLNIFSLSLDDVNQGGITQVNDVFNTSFFGANIAIKNNQLFLGADRSLYQLDLNNSIDLEFVGDTHSDTEFNGEFIRGLVYVD